ncbi:ActS/PrrB/RegB family redox-sensitive histidine kinase [Aliiroseovarius sp. S1339]|uniref:sensor histidine kinase RegB n=1 Tax=Aliiroseovarius sp. S1339 TaxID=2936990 RepID=UPI0020BF5E4E|nr:ActS/PrrB/RegB family redox-sensitive histidine kinase [Aliiroseovarius sp. S1339]MCK8463317.1 ActS/PrrB/RegB family redox-sensitive histidine kinase [Aliiroseovarius sp. S1339]
MTDSNSRFPTQQMLQPAPEVLQRRWVLLRTLVALRWAAVFGQIAAIVVSIYVFSLQINLGLAAVAIGLAAIANLVSLSVFPKNARLDERQATWMLLFDTLQLAFMVFLTGGLHNPFIVLIVAPVTVAATALSTRATVIVGSVAIAATTAVADVNIPLHTRSGETVLMPDLFVFGIWVAVVTSIGFVGIYTRRISSEVQSMSEALQATQMALSREQKLTDLGGVIAAAAHELGTPLATIKLVATELVDELDGNTDLRDDAALIGQQADRCRDILQSMGRAGKDDMLMKSAPLVTLVEEAAEPHADRGKILEISVMSELIDPSDEPIVARRPEIIHGLRNLIQNAVDYATTTVWIEIDWTKDEIKLRIIDDGRGYAPQLIGWIGDPSIRRKKPLQDKGQRREYKGMGLGLFIAKTLLERTGAQLSFANGTEPYTGRPHPREKSGAIAQVVWPRDTGGIEQKPTKGGLGENVQFGLSDLPGENTG